MRERCVAALAALFLFSVVGLAAGMVHVRGELTCDSCNNYTGYTVELQELSGARPPDRIIVEPTGEFQSYVRAGTYMLTVTAGGVVIATETVTIRNGFGMLSVGISGGDEKAVPGTGVVSVARMRHKVPKKAAKEYKAAHKKYEAGDVDASLEHLKRATEIDPDYLEAWNNLGCRYLSKRQPAEALAALERAAQIDKDAPFVHTNMAIALMALGNMARSEEAARTALSIDSRDKKARYLLGLSLVAQREFTAETVFLLRQVQDDFPNAKLALAETLARRGKVEQAKSVLKDHIQSASSDTRPKAEEMLGSLN
jgi:Tfp pilus assembly protein PilF